MSSPESTGTARSSEDDDQGVRDAVVPDGWGGLRVRDGDTQRQGGGRRAGHARRGVGGDDD